MYTRTKSATTAHMEITEITAAQRLHFQHLMWTEVIRSVADPYHFGVDPDPDLDPRIHASD